MPPSPEPPGLPETPHDPGKRRSKPGFKKAARAVMFLRRSSKENTADPQEAKDHRWARRPRTDANQGGRMDQVRGKVWQAFENPHSSIVAKVIHMFILGCIVLSSVCIHLESMPELDHYAYLWAFLEFLFVVVFTAEYLLRFWATPQTTKEFVWERYNMIDLIAILPFYNMIDLIAIL